MKKYKVPLAAEVSVATVERVRQLLLSKLRMRPASRRKLPCIKSHGRIQRKVAFRQAFLKGS
jgi:hypothetical protein